MNKLPSPPRLVRWLCAALWLLLWQATAWADYTALSFLKTTGNYPPLGAYYVVGQDFEVIKPITVNSIGSFDSGQDGFINTVNVAIYSQTTQTIIAGTQVALTTATTTLVGKARFKTITPVTLPAGHYTIVAAGYKYGGDLYYWDSALNYDTTTIDHAGNYIRLENYMRFQGVLAANYATLVYPTGVVGVSSSGYCAGTFTYAPVSSSGEYFPAGVRGPITWMRASDTGLSDGGTLASWSNAADTTRPFTNVNYQPIYRNNNSYNINFNSVVEYSDYLHSMSTSTLLTRGTHYQAHTFFVGYPLNSTDLAQTFDEHSNPGEFELWLPYNGKLMSYQGDVFYNAVTATPLATVGYALTPNIYMAHLDTQNNNYPGPYQGVRENGIELSETYPDGSATAKPLVGLNSTMYLGYGTFMGRIGEILIYLDTPLTPTRTAQIESYLGIKYGITLGGNGSTTYSYLSGDDGTGTASVSTIWTAATGYHYNVTGIGRQDYSLLDQRISRSSNTGTQITVASGGSMPTGASTVTPTSGTAFASDLSYMLWGDNNGTATSTTNFSSGTYSGVAHSNRIWRVQTTNGGPASATFCIPDSLWPSGFTSNARLLMAGDAAFTTLVTNVAMTAGTCPASGYGVTTSVAGRVATVTPSQVAPSSGVGYFTLVNVSSAGVHHLNVTTSGSSGLTCSPTTFTITACADASCSTLYTSGISGTLTLTGSGGTVVFPSGSGFSIASGASSTTVSAQITVAPSAGYVTVGLSSLSLTPTGSSAPYCGLGTSASSGNSCQYGISSAGLVLSAIANHVSDVSQSFTVSAVKSNDTSTACVPAFASVNKAITFKCSYANPSTGSLPARVGGVAVNSSQSSAAACDATGAPVTLSFNSSGVATTSLQYADVGSVGLTASYTSSSGSDSGLSMTGSSSFIAAPKNFTVVPSGSYTAGKAFSATITARNNSGAVTPNFGKETSPEKVLLSFAKYQPTGTGASAGSFTGTGVSSAVSSFSSGVLSVSDLKWSEVGTGDLTATLNSGNYLSSGLTATGTTGTTGGVGPFIPDHFNLVVSQGCGSGFTYSGQPFTATITALSGAGTTTVNYDGTSATTPNFAKAVTLSATSNASTGSLSSTSVAASSFSQGVATLSNTSFAYTSKLTAPYSVSLRAIDTSGVSSATGTEGAVALRSGRVHVSNAFGSEKTALSVPVMVQYWTGQAWAINTADSCTTSIPAAAVVRVNYLDRKGASTTAWTTTPSAISLSAGHGSLTLSAPSPTSTGTVDFALNLGSTTTDQSCLSSHPSSTGAGLSWLRSMNGRANACTTTSYDRDPSARATFGIYSPESQKEVFIKDLF